MSYDIEICVKTEMPNKWGNQFVVIDRPEYDSPTYNLRDMFVACMEWDYKQGEYYKITYVLPKIRHGIIELTDNREAYERYNPPNGWGDLYGALECLESLHTCIYECLEDWSIEALYMKW